MKRLFTLLAVGGMLFTACTKSDLIDEEGTTEQPGSNNTDTPDNSENPDDKMQNIKFQDENTKLLCTLLWDENEDGELSYEEAAAVTNLGKAFKGSAIMAFNELEYFTGVIDISDSEFEGCSSLVKISLPEQITTIGENAFADCANLLKIVIPNKVTSIYDSAFRGCKSLTSVIIGNSVTEIGYKAFDDCASLASVTIGNSVTSIGDGAFYDCNSLTSVTIPNSVTEIEENAFRSSGLTSVTIGNGVTKIGACAFEGCKLKEVYCKPTTPPAADKYIFDGNPSLNKIYVPLKSVNAYKSATNWSRYYEIVGYNF